MPAPKPAAPFAFKVPYYQQSLNFTCGPASLLMVMKAFGLRKKMERTEEMVLWREATTLLWPRGPGFGGCMLVGLAAAAGRRGLEAEIHADWNGGGSDPYAGFRTRVRDRVEVPRLLWRHDLERAQESGARYQRGWPGLEGIEARFNEGWLPVLLVNCKYLHGSPGGHWVVMTGFDEDSFYINDPWICEDQGQTAADVTNRAIPRRKFVGVAQYAGHKVRSVLFLRRADANGRVARLGQAA